MRTSAIIIPLRSGASAISISSPRTLPKSTERHGAFATISGGEEIVFVSAKGDVKHPVTGEKLAPRALFGDSPMIEEESDREPRLLSG